MRWTAGERLFAQYAHAPNALGYCGPEAADGLLAGARGEHPPIDVRAIARGFSGAWPYQDVIAELSGLSDPLDPDVVRAYWTGNQVTKLIEPAEFGTALLARIKPQAGHYWAHLDDELLREALPTHAFHVFAVYPWSRMLSLQRPEPLEVLDSCRIAWATVLETSGDTVTVEHTPLTYDGELGLGPPASRTVTDEGFAGELATGDTVALHWGRVCDRLTTNEAALLEYWTRRQIELSNPRIRAGGA
ncbi:hypothetical protein ACVW00_003275 [Marmoricola sp. URHA0025 HA25]